MIDGILPIDKPIGWTSHDVVARVRRVARQRQVGHAGTLDPLASGLLLLVLGSATRLSSYLMEGTKTYCAEVVLGATTKTDDAEGPLESQADISHIDLPAIRVALAHFTGDIDQIPPAYAAVRHHGEKLYMLARKGAHVRPEARRVRIDYVDLLAWSPPRLRLRVTCGSGTYIRALARDIGATLGVGGYLHVLRRVASGSFHVTDALPLENLDEESLNTHLQPPDRAILTLPAVVLDYDNEQRLIHGAALSLSKDNRSAGIPSSPTPSPVHGRGGNEDIISVGTVAPSLSSHAAAPTSRSPDTTRSNTVRVYSQTGTLLALASLSDNLLQPRRVFARI
ncbi:MAG TPA: tRNA pseudouridine(55) synthase TruB [Chloroflexota bacterium]|nr:tRNA pseudouridine(55) synthase TruB [Chloroflexota bacterium]